MIVDKVYVHILYVKYEDSISILFPGTTKCIGYPHISLTWTRTEIHMYTATKTESLPTPFPKK